LRVLKSEKSEKPTMIERVNLSWKPIWGDLLLLNKLNLLKCFWLATIRNVRTAIIALGEDIYILKFHVKSKFPLLSIFYEESRL